MQSAACLNNPSIFNHSYCFETDVKVMLRQESMHFNTFYRLNEMNWFKSKIYKIVIRSNELTNISVLVGFKYLNELYPRDGLSLTLTGNKVK